MSRIATGITNTLANTWGSARSQRVDNLVTAINTTRVRVVCLVLMTGLLLTYLWLVNSAATSGFYLSNLEQQRVALDDEYKKLQVEQTALRSLDHIQDASQNMHMVASSTVQYVQDSSVALRGQ